MLGGDLVNNNEEITGHLDGDEKKSSSPLSAFKGKIGRSQFHKFHSIMTVGKDHVIGLSQGVFDP